MTILHSSILNCVCFTFVLLFVAFLISVIQKEDVRYAVTRTYVHIISGRPYACCACVSHTCVCMFAACACVYIRHLVCARMRLRECSDRPYICCACVSVCMCSDRPCIGLLHVCSDRPYVCIYLTAHTFACVCAPTARPYVFSHCTYMCAWLKLF